MILGLNFFSLRPSDVATEKSEYGTRGPELSLAHSPQHRRRLQVIQYLLCANLNRRQKHIMIRHMSAERHSVSRRVHRLKFTPMARWVEFMVDCSECRHYLFTRCAIADFGRGILTLWPPLGCNGGVLRGCSAGLKIPANRITWIT